MGNYRPFETPKIRNPETEARHRREVFWQITIPLLVFILVLILLVLLIAVGGAGDLSTWADISTIWLIIPMIIFGVIFLVLTVAIVYGISRLLAVLPYYAFRAQIFFFRARNAVRIYSDKAVEPVFKVRSRSAAVKSIWQDDSDGNNSGQADNAL